MKLRMLILPLIVAGAALGLASHSVSAQDPGTTGQQKLVGGLMSPRGLKMGPDGMLYVAEAGVGGETAITVEGAEHLVGFSSRISKVDPETGVRTTVADKLPSDFGTETMDSVGAADVAFLGGNLYYLQTHGGTAYGFPDNPTGIYRVEANGSVELVADIGQFNLDNPIDDLTSGAQADIEPGGNPYAMIVRDGAFYVTDGNQNQVMKVTLDGTVSRIMQFVGHPVSTGIASQSGGPLYVSALGTFPFAATDGRVFKVGFPTGNVSEYASGFSSMTDVEFGPGGKLYALNFGDQATEPGPPWIPFSAKILLVNEDGTMSPLVGGFTFATALIFDGDTAYVSNNGLTIPGVFDGEIVKIENFSAIEPEPAPQPTTAPPPPPKPVATAVTGTIRPPDTGMGTGTSGDGSNLLLIVMLVGVAGVACVGGVAVGAKR